MASSMKNVATVVNFAACVVAASAAQWQSNGVTAAEVAKHSHSHKLMRRVAGSVGGTGLAEGGVDVDGTEDVHATAVEEAAGSVEQEQQQESAAEKTEATSEAETTEGSESTAEEASEQGAAAAVATEEAEASDSSAAEASEEEKKKDNNDKAADKEEQVLLFCNTGNDAAPGPPKIEGMSMAMKDQNATIAALGDRLVKAATDASEAAKSCGSFFSFGEFVWCSKAMPLDSEFAKKNLYGGAYCNATDANVASLEQGATKGYKQMDGSVKETRELNNGNIEGLSYGVGENDPWSEMMSSMFWLTTRLYDCKPDIKQGPFATDMRGKHNRDTDPCTDRHCYTVGYEKQAICLGEKEETVEGRRYLPLHEAIHNRPPISAHIKIDVEGAEWAVLEQLTKNEDDMAAIRSLDMKLNFAAQSSVPFERRVELVEELSNKFAVAGSTIEPLFKSLHQDFERDRAKDASYQRGASTMYTTSGFPLDQFSMSFVNRKLL